MPTTSLYTNENVEAVMSKDSAFSSFVSDSLLKFLKKDRHDTKSFEYMYTAETVSHIIVISESEDRSSITISMKEE